MYPLILKFYLKIDKMRLKNASEKGFRNTLELHFIYYFYLISLDKEKRTASVAVLLEKVFLFMG